LKFKICALYAAKEEKMSSRNNHSSIKPKAQTLKPELETFQPKKTIEVLEISSDDESSNKSTVLINWDEDDEENDIFFVENYDRFGKPFISVKFKKIMAMIQLSSKHPSILFPNAQESKSNNPNIKA
jgi:hypothetical protein